jgi:hypothetical protein
VARRTAWRAEPENAKDERLGPSGGLADRIVHQHQEVGLELAGSPAVNGGYRGGNSAQPRQEHSGEGDHPLAALLGGQLDQVSKNSALQVVRHRRMLEQDPQFAERDQAGG